MADVVLGTSLLAVLAAVLLAGARALFGPSRTRLRMAGRVALALIIATTGVGIGVYQLTKSRTFQLAGTLVPRVDTAERVVALTFDDGPNPAHTDEVLRVLDDADITATFYLTGAEMAENPAAARAIAGAGHELGNHTYTHRRMYFLSADAASAEIERTDVLIRDAGYAGPITFRPPGCKRFLSVPLYLARTDRTTVTWDLEPDSIGEIADDPDALVEHVVTNVRPGSIILMHVMYDARAASREALGRIIGELQADGYRFVTVSELIALGE